MDFSVSPRAKDVCERVAAFLTTHVLPHERTFIAQPFFAAEPKLEALRARVRDLGLWGPQLPRELGGLGLSLVEHGLVSEVLGRTPYGHYLFGCQAPDAGNIEILHKFGSEAQKERWLLPLARGELRSCFSMTEPENPGSNPTLLSCTATSDGDDYMIDGHKWFTSSADGAAFAIVMAVTNPGEVPHLRASQIIVPTNTPGFRIARNIPVCGHSGEGYPSHAEVYYERCRVPKANRLGAEGAGFLIAQERLGPGRIHHCMRWLGICERAFDLMCQRAAARESAAGRTLADEPLVQASVAECRARIESARLFVLQTAWKIDNVGFSAARADVSLIKFHTADVLSFVVDRAIQVWGAAGLTDETPLPVFFTQERGARIYDGPDEVHKLSAAKALLRGYKKEAESARAAARAKGG